jgi:hypothetical protein
MVLLPLDSDRVCVSLQVLDVSVESSSNSSRTQVTISDGVHFFPVMLAKHLQRFVDCGDISRGAFVSVTNYVLQTLSNRKIVIICLDLSVMSVGEAVNGSPLEFIPPPTMSKEEIEFIGVTSDNVCLYCEQIPCEWLHYGRSVVDSVRAKSSSSPSTDISLINKSCRHDAYRMYTRAKYGYMGKGRRVPLPTCVVDGIRANFPDMDNNYICFTPTTCD